MKSYGLTDVGQKRSLNQDTIYCSDTPVGTLQNLYLVADGMGGQNAGDFASKYTVENLVQLLQTSTNPFLISKIDTIIHQVNRMLVRQANENLEMFGMGTTLVLATIEDNILYVANVGDSRLYVEAGQELCQITRDHSYVEEMVSMGRMTRDSDEYRMRKNIITRAIGSHTGVTVDYFEIELSPGKQVILCTDGLTNMVSDAEIYQVITRDLPLKDKVEALIDMANRNGGQDNISVIIIDPEIER